MNYNILGHKLPYQCQLRSQFCHQVYRTFFTRWLNRVFNQYSRDRVKEVGPDRACAEWLLRCGAHVRWQGSGGFQTDYNSLPQGGSEKYKIEEINAENAAVMSVGFKHLDGVKHLTKMRFKLCAYLDDDAMKELSYVKQSLRHLEIGSCDISDRGLMHLAELSALSSLLLYDLPTVKDKQGCKDLLQKQLVNCDISFPDIERDKKI